MFSVSVAVHGQQTEPHDYSANTLPVFMAFLPLLVLAAKGEPVTVTLSGSLDRVSA